MNIGVTTGTLFSGWNGLGEAAKLADSKPGLDHVTIIQ